MSPWEDCGGCYHCRVLISPFRGGCSSPERSCIITATSHKLPCTSMAPPSPLSFVSLVATTQLQGHPWYMREITSPHQLLHHPPYVSPWWVTIANCGRNPRSIYRLMPVSTWAAQHTQTSENVPAESQGWSFVTSKQPIFPLPCSQSHKSTKAIQLLIWR